MRRRTWKLRLCAAWLAGTGIGIIAIRQRRRPAEVEQVCREVLLWRDAGAARRLSKQVKVL